MGLLSKLTGSKQTTKSSPWGPAKGHLKNVLGGAEELYNASPGMNTSQEAGAGMLEGYAGSGQLTGLLSQGAGANQLMMDPSEMLNPNQYLQQHMGSVFDRMGETFQERIAPSISRGAVTSSPQGWNSMKEGRALSDAAGEMFDSMGDVGAQMASTGYGQGLDAMSSGLMRMPQTAQAGAMPAGMMMQAGDYRQNVPWKNLGQYADVATGVGGMGGKQVTTGTPSPLSTIGKIGQFGTGLYGAMSYPEQYYGG